MFILITYLLVSCFVIKKKILFLLFKEIEVYFFYVKVGSLEIFRGLTILVF